MFASVQIRKRWRELQEGRPGHRFQEWYERGQCPDRRGGMVWRFAAIVVALLCLSIALLLSVFPGPAIPFFLIAGALLAVESRRIAKLLDWIEVQVRHLWRQGLRIWKRLSSTHRVLVVALSGGVSVTITYVAYRLFWR